MSHALLLRLFLSPSFFNVHVALQYLALYSDHVGITYYLTHRLRELDTQQLREVWGFICHLLVTRPSKSRALESFVAEVSERSTHIAFSTLWFMQAALNDLAPTRRTTQSFIICQRVLHQCHEIIFGDPPQQTSSPYSNISLPLRSRFSSKRVKANIAPALVGLGTILGGAPGMPMLTQVMGEVAVDQGRFDFGEQGIRSVENGEDLASGGSKQILQDDDDDSDVESPADEGDAQPQAARPPPLEHTTSERRQTLSAARTSPMLPYKVLDLRKSGASIDPLGQLDDHAPTTPLPSQSSPALPSMKRHRYGSPNSIDNIMQKYGMGTQMHLLRSHYCRSEIQFLLALENISNRLLVIPRPARVSALRAELTALNHKLPAEVCMPLWCTSSDAPQISPDGVPQPHHRIVRIPPGESVVLNSAERAPYVLMLEVLHNDLDFNPIKRSNKDVLKKIVVKELEKKGSSQRLATFGSGIARDSSSPDTVGDHTVSENERSLDGSGLPAIGDIVPPTPTSAKMLVEPEEEIDLVEQLYGTDEAFRARGVDLSESIVLPPAPKNRDLDIAAWSRVSSTSPSTPVEGTPRSAAFSSTFGGGDTTTDWGGNEHVLSLEEYSERMRTAAVMLAQLNASMTWETIAASPVVGPGQGSDPSSSRTWFSGARKPTDPTASDVSEGKGPLHPSLGGSHVARQSSASVRRKLSPAEAGAIRDRIMKEMLSLEEERMERMLENREADRPVRIGPMRDGAKTAEDETIIRRELNKADPSAVVFRESWAAKKSRIRQGSPYGHLASWDLFSCIVKTGGDLRQEQFATQLIQAFQHIWAGEGCQCWLRYFRILATSGDSGLVETITDAVSVHSIKKAEYARRLNEGGLGHVTIMDHFKLTYGDPSSAKFARAQRNFAKSLAGYSVVSYLLQIKDRHNGNILLDRDGHLIHIDFGFMLSNSPGNIGFEAAPFKLPLEYVEVLGGIDSEVFLTFRRLFREGFEAARKHCDRIITLVELMQKDSNFPCFAALGEQTATQLRERFQPTLTHSLVGDHVDRLIDTSLGSNWTRLYDSFQYYSQGVL